MLWYRKKTNFILLVGDDPQTDRAGVPVLEPRGLVIASGGELVRDGLANSAVTGGDGVGVAGRDALLTEVLSDSRLVVEGSLLISSALELLEVDVAVAGLGDERSLQLRLGWEGEDNLALLTLVTLGNVKAEDCAVTVTDVSVVLSAVGGVRLVAVDGDDQARLQVRVHAGEITGAVSSTGGSGRRLLRRRNLGLSDRGLRDSGGLGD